MVNVFCHRLLQVFSFYKLILFCRSKGIGQNLHSRFFLVWNIRIMFGKFEPSYQRFKHVLQIIDGNCESLVQHFQTIWRRKWTVGTPEQSFINWQKSLVLENKHIGLRYQLYQFSQGDLNSHPLVILNFFSQISAFDHSATLPS